MSNSKNKIKNSFFPKNKSKQSRVLRISCISLQEEEDQEHPGQVSERYKKQFKKNNIFLETLYTSICT